MLAVLVGIILFSSLVLGLIANKCPSNPSEPSEDCPLVLYDFADFDKDGAFIGFTSGEVQRLAIYSDEKLEGNENWNDKTSSYKVYSGYKVNFYENDLLGRSTTFNIPTKDNYEMFNLLYETFSGGTLNNQISSLRIINVGGATGENCVDKVDNDGDGKADCQDSSCHQKIGALFETQNCLLTGGCNCNYQAELVCNDGFDNDGITNRKKF